MMYAVAVSRLNITDLVFASIKDLIILDVLSIL